MKERETEAVRGLGTLEERKSAAAAYACAKESKFKRVTHHFGEEKAEGREGVGIQQGVRAEIAVFSKQTSCFFLVTCFH